MVAKLKQFTIILLVLLFNGCSEENIKSEKYIWSEITINKIFKDSCIKSENWKDKNPSEVMEEDRSLQITGFIDTSEYTPIPTALVVGFCAIGEGGGWGNELFLVGHNSKLNQPNYVIKEIFDESSGLTFSANMIKKEKDNLRLVLEGYSSRSEPACCRDVIDIVQLFFDKEIPKYEFLTNNSYQAKEWKNK